LNINLYENEKARVNASKVTSLSLNKEFKRGNGIERYMNVNPRNKLEEYHISSVLLNWNKKKNIAGLFGLAVDSKIELEKAGLSIDQKPYRVIISLEDSLDYILSNITNCDIRIANKIKGYKELSRGLLNLDLGSIRNKRLDSFINIDRNLDKYFMGLIERNYTSLDLLMEFVKDVVKFAYNAVAYIAVYIKYFYEEQGYSIVVKSRGSCSIVLTSTVEINEDIILDGNYLLHVKSYTGNNYIDDVMTSRGEVYENDRNC